MIDSPGYNRIGVGPTEIRAPEIETVHPPVSGSLHRRISGFDYIRDSFSRVVILNVTMTFSRFNI